MNPASPYFLKPFESGHMIVNEVFRGKRLCGLEKSYANSFIKQEQACFY